MKRQISTYLLSIFICALFFIQPGVAGIKSPEEGAGYWENPFRRMGNFALSASTAACIYNSLVRQKSSVQEVWLGSIPLYAVYALKVDGKLPKITWRRRFVCLKGIREPIKPTAVFDDEIVHLHQDVYLSPIVPSFAKHNLNVVDQWLPKDLASYCVSAKGTAFRHAYLLVFPLEVVAQKEKRFNKEEWQISIKKWRWGYQIGCFKTEAERQSALYKAAIKLGIVIPKQNQLPQRKGKGRGG